MSISACWAVFDWPSIVDAASVSRHEYGEQLGGAQDDRGAVVEGHRAPGRGSGQGRVDRVLGVLLGGAAEGADDGLVVVRLDDLELLAAAEALHTADGHRQLARVLGQLLELDLEAGALGEPGA